MRQIYLATAFESAPTERTTPVDVEAYRLPPDPWAAFWFRLSQSHGGEYLTATFETLDPDGPDHIRQSVLQYQGREAQRVTFEALAEADVKRTEAA